MTLLYRRQRRPDSELPYINLLVGNNAQEQIEAQTERPSGIYATVDTR